MSTVTYRLYAKQTFWQGETTSWRFSDRTNSGEGHDMGILACIA